MTKELYREDDLLSSFGSHLAKYGFLILALSGNQQGRYWFQIDGYRKAPDIIAFRSDMVLVGEAKVKSRELFRSKQGRKSDYSSLQHLLNSNSAKKQLSDMILQSLALITTPIAHLPPLQAIVVGGDSFATLQDSLVDDRIWQFTIDKDTGIVTERAYPLD